MSAEQGGGPSPDEIQKAAVDAAHVLVDATPPVVPEYADLDQTAIDKAAMTEAQIAKTRADYDSSIKGPNWGMPGSEYALRVTPKADKANLSRVDQMFTEAHKENAARDVIAAGGVDEKQSAPWSGIYEPGSSQKVDADASVKGRQRDHISHTKSYGTVPRNEFGIGPDGTAYVRRTEGQVASPDQEKAFNPNHQEKAKELIQRLADKQGERKAERQRQYNKKGAQETIDRLNAPRPTTEETQQAA